MRTMWQRIGSWAGFAAAFAGLAGGPALAGGLPDCDPVPVVANHVVEGLPGGG